MVGRGVGSGAEVRGGVLVCSVTKLVDWYIAVDSISDESVFVLAITSLVMGDLVVRCAEVVVSDLNSRVMCGEGVGDGVSAKEVLTSAIVVGMMGVVE